MHVAWSADEPVSALGPLRVVVVVCLVGLTWLLAHMLLGGENSLVVVRHLFHGEVYVLCLCFCTVRVAVSIQRNFQQLIC